jgi:hypothetical protein
MLGAIVTPALSFGKTDEYFNNRHKEAIISYLARPIIRPGYELVSPQMKERDLVNVSDENKF